MRSYVSAVFLAIAMLASMQMTHAQSIKYPAVLGETSCNTTAATISVINPTWASAMDNSATLNAWGTSVLASVSGISNHNCSTYITGLLGSCRVQMTVQDGCCTMECHEGVHELEEHKPCYDAVLRSLNTPVGAMYKDPVLRTIMRCELGRLPTIPSGAQATAPKVLLAVLATFVMLAVMWA